ncbi:hypothetical protein BU15DRAFT_72398 [Melanogaster broomeanus]|nr:hypothetical protein BU15DRAFT_72398 [Melanogaster broomeanus]
MTNYQPSGEIAKAFKQYINNEIPPRFIDTSTMKFVEREKVFGVFQDEIAKVTDQVIVASREVIQEIVKYAIFSHRWAAEEPTFQDVTAGKHNIGGFEKLKRFCKTAKSLGYKACVV